MNHDITLCSPETFLWPSKDTYVEDVVLEPPEQSHGALECFHGEEVVGGVEDQACFAKCHRTLVLNITAL